MDWGDPVEFCTQRLALMPDARQAEVLRSTAKRGALNCARQWGKSTITAAKAVHRAWSRAGALVIFASPTERQSAELLRKAAGMVRRLGIKPRGDGDNAHSLVFPNGSRIVALPGTEATVRGFSQVSLMLIDEASRVTDALYLALRPMLIVGDGDLWLMSTPYGQRGFFYDAFNAAAKTWERFTVPATENPRIRPDQLEQEREAMGSSHFAQEYQCEFVDNGTMVFDQILIDAAFDDTVQALVIP